MTRALERLLRLQRGDLPRGLLLFAYLLLVVCAYVVGQVARDALFLGRFAASSLPYVDVSVFLLVGVVVAVYVRFGRYHSLDRLLVVTLVLFGATGLLFAALARGAAPRWLFPVVYIWVGVFGVARAGAGVDPRELGAHAPRGAPAVRVGRRRRDARGDARRPRQQGARAAVRRREPARARVGPPPRRARARRAPVEGAAGARGDAVGAARRAGQGEPPRTACASSSRSKHLQAIAGIVLLSSFVTALSGWQMKAIAQQSLSGQDALASFFGGFNAWVGGLCLVTQVLFTAGILRRLGLGNTLLLLPFALLAGSSGLLAFGTLAAAVLMRGSDKVLRYSVDRPAVELLYLPVPTAAKLPAKSFIDTVVWRAGDGLAGLAVLAFATFGGVRPVPMTLVNVPLLVAWLVLAARVHRRYVSTLEETLQQHRIDAERADTPVVDRETEEVLAARLSAADPQEILYALDIMALGRRAAAHPAVRGLLDHPITEVRGPRPAILAEAGERSCCRGPRSCCGDPAIEVRTEALLFLARHSDTDPVARVQDLGDYPDSSVRAALVAVLARLGGDRLEAARPVFELMAAEPGPAGRPVRLEAARLAERIALPFEEPLRRLIADEDEEVAAAAIRAAMRHGPKPFVGAIAGPAPRGGSRRPGGGRAGGGRRRRTPRARCACCPRPSSPPDARRGGVLGARADRRRRGGVGPRRSPARRRCLAAAAHPRGARPHEGRRTRPRARRAPDRGGARRRDPRPLPLVPDPRHGGRLATPSRPPSPRACARRCARSSSGSSACSTSSSRSATSARRGSRCSRVTASSTTRRSTCSTACCSPACVSCSYRSSTLPSTSGSGRPSPSGSWACRSTGPRRAVAALVGTGDPWLRSCAAYAIGALGLRSLAPQLDAWADDPDPLLRETVRQARARLASGVRS